MAPRQFGRGAARGIRRVCDADVRVREGLAFPRGLRARKRARFQARRRRGNFYLFRRGGRASVKGGLQNIEVTDFSISYEVD